MKRGIHPDYHPVVFQDATTGATFLTRSTLTSDRTIDIDTPNGIRTYPLITVEVTSDSQPLWTGRRRFPGHRRSGGEVPPTLRTAVRHLPISHRVGPYSNTSAPSDLHVFGHDRSSGRTQQSSQARRLVSGHSQVLPARRRRKGDEAMVLHGLLAKAATTVVTGVVGVAAYDGVRKLIAKAPVHEAGVTATAWSLRGVRKAEEGAEKARLAIGDVVAEARERIGEEAPPPTVGEAVHDHDH
jgi:ribosomal protein L31